MTSTIAAPGTDPDLVTACAFIRYLKDKRDRAGALLYDESKSRSASIDRIAYMARQYQECKENADYVSNLFSDYIDEQLFPF